MPIQADTAECNMANHRFLVTVVLQTYPDCLHCIYQGDFLLLPVVQLWNCLGPRVDEWFGWELGLEECHYHHFRHHNRQHDHSYRCCRQLLVGGTMPELASEQILSSVSVCMRSQAALCRPFGNFLGYINIFDSSSV